MKLTGRMSHRISYVFNYPGIIFYAMKHWNLKEVEKRLNELQASNPAIVAMDRASLSKDHHTFVFDGTAYPYFYHPYNNIQRNERSIEVPIIWDQVCRSRGGAILEIGNVLSHYFDVSHIIVDKYEVAPGVANIDVVDLDQTPRFDLIVSISTLEHVGWDESPRNPKKFLTALRVLTSTLKPGGRLMFTVPYGYNNFVSRLIRIKSTVLGKVSLMRRVSFDNRWEQCNSIGKDAEYCWHIRKETDGPPFTGANVVAVCSIERNWN
jgi:SAM-dependent methyltransferase